MSPRVLLLVAPLAIALVACAESPAPSEPATAAPQSVETPLNVQRLYKVFAPGEITFDDLDARRKTRDRTYFAAGPRSQAFKTCLGEAGLSDHVMAQCDYDEAERLTQELNALLSAVTPDPKATPANAQSDWERETVEGCAWSPSEEGTAGELGVASCVTNRLANRVAELSGETCHFPAPEFHGQTVICTKDADEEERQGEQLLDTRSALDSSFRDAKGNSREFSDCLANAGGVTDSLLACIERESERQQARIDGALERASVGSELGGVWAEFRRETERGCVWYPTLEGSAARIDSASCVLNRLTNYAEQLDITTARSADND